MCVEFLHIFLFAPMFTFPGFHTAIVMFRSDQMRGWIKFFLAEVLSHEGLSEFYDLFCSSARYFQLICSIIPDSISPVLVVYSVHLTVSRPDYLFLWLFSL